MPLADVLAGDDATLHGMLHHMLEETARHAHHLELLRERVDGEAGHY